MGDKVTISITIEPDGEQVGWYWINDDKENKKPFNPSLPDLSGGVAGTNVGTKPLSWWDRFKAWLHGESVAKDGDFVE